MPRRLPTVTVAANLSGDPSPVPSGRPGSFALFRIGDPEAGAIVTVNSLPGGPSIAGALKLAQAEARRRWPKEV
jgi:hypothetical protein